MNEKDRAYLRGELKKQYEQICGMEFWQDFVSRLEDERRVASRHCEVDAPENIAKWQGFIRCVDVIKGLPLDVIEVTPRKL